MAKNNEKQGVRVFKDNNEWFCGVTGSGKTHIATAVSVELIKADMIIITLSLVLIYQELHKA